MKQIFRIITILMMQLMFAFIPVMAHAQGNEIVFAQQMANALDKIVANKYDEAMPLLEQVIVELKKHNCPNDEIALYQKALGTCKLNTGKIRDAEEIYLDAVKSISSPEYANSKIVRQLYDALSVLYCQVYVYDKAKYYCENAKFIYEINLDFGLDYVQCLSNASMILYNKGNKMLAKLLIDVALRQAKKNLDNKPSVDDGLGLYLNLDSLDNNMYIDQCIIPYVAILSNASMLYCDMDYTFEAIKAARSAIKLAEKYNLVMPLLYNNLGYIYMGDSKYAKATKIFQKAYTLCRSTSDVEMTGSNLAFGLFLSNDSSTSSFCVEFSEKLRKNIHETFAFMGGPERRMYWEQVGDYIMPYLNLFIYERGQPCDYGTIYNNVLESKGILLRSTNAVRDAILQSSNVDDKQDYERMIQLKQQLQTETDPIISNNLIQEIEEIDKRLSRHVSEYANFATSNSVDWKSVRDALTKDDAAIEFYNIPIVWGLDSISKFDSEPRICALVLKKGYKTPHIIPLCKERSITNLEQEDIYETDSIYRLIWQPLENELEGVRNIYFSADRELHKIGIEYVPVSNGAIIGDRYNIYRLSSTRTLAKRPMGRKTNNAVLYGGLRYDVDKDDLITQSRSGGYHSTSASRAFSVDDHRYGLKYLPGTLKEVEEISRSFSVQPRLITGISGTEESFKSLAGMPIDIIHLATHGFFWDDEDAKKRDYVSFLKANNRVRQTEEDKALMRSGLLFSGANIGLRGESLPNDVEDGVLTALELSNMNLGNVDMVVMSACESGLGETSGEGVFGLQRGFKLAGANTLLMSLWKVDDTVTQILMTEYYTHYLSGKSKQASLKLAQQTLRNSSEYSSPQYWAAFIILDAIN